MSNVSAAVVTDNYLRLDRPVIVTDGTRDWPAMEEGVFNRHRLVEVSLGRTSVMTDIGGPKLCFQCADI